MGKARKDGMVMALPGERFTPFTLAKKLGARAILESASFRQGRERYSLLLVDEAFRLTQDGGRVILRAGGTDRIMAGMESGAETGKGRDILDVLSDIAAQNEGFADRLPVPGAGVGFLGYSFARRCDKVRIADRPDPIGAP
ncbi:MAG TPA: hypothetical protein VLH39_09005, partial [Magnetospirillaceae bacterium]|nr:hypothetical protein [Magnetospirillaceae bacterium]